MDDDERFELFWNEYPRKVGKPKAKEKLLVILKNSKGKEVLFDFLMQKLREQKEKWTQIKYVPHPTTWLNQERWLNEPDEELVKGDTSVGEMVLFLAKGFGYDLTNDRLRIYEYALKDVPPETLMKAFKQILFEDEHFPSLARVIKAVRGLPSAYDAWEEVTRMVNEAFVYREPVFSNPVIERAVKVIGWRNICTLYAGDLNTTRAHFFKVYESLSNRINTKVGDSLCMTSVKRIMNTDTSTQIGSTT